MIIGTDTETGKKVSWFEDQINVKRGRMNNVIMSTYEYTKDAALVQKYFGYEIPDTFTGALLLKAHKEEYLTEAKRLEALSKHKA